MSYKSNESGVLSKSRCPQCFLRGRDRTGDNLALYSDGHAYCFACKYFKPSNKRKQILNELSSEIIARKNAELNQIDKLKQVTLPEDCKINLDIRAGRWLSGYDITMDECLKFGICWSPSREGLVFPFYEQIHQNGVVLKGYQLRNFVKGRPKYVTSGPVEQIYYYHGLDKAAKRGIIIVEDCISAIKVGRLACTLPLLGSHLPAHKQRNMMNKSDKLTFWLDYDMAEEAYKQAATCSQLGYETRVIVTKEDPKYYDEEEIVEILEGVGY